MGSGGLVKTLSYMDLVFGYSRFFHVAFGAHRVIYCCDDSYQLIDADFWARSDAEEAHGIVLDFEA